MEPFMELPRCNPSVEAVRAPLTVPRREVLPIGGVEDLRGEDERELLVDAERGMTVDELTAGLAVVGMGQRSA
jgi:hypothetical protein